MASIYENELDDGLYGMVNCIFYGTDLQESSCPGGWWHQTSGSGHQCVGQPVWGADDCADESDDAADESDDAAVIVYGSGAAAHMTRTGVLALLRSRGKFGLCGS